ncbi:glutathione S-transferase [Mesorhizobium sp. J18]|uniref:glutathione S-transferase family protein n=1 Tax=Mesorhizobium sp. J18 TaxID=935263 RepID=UPI00119BB7DE|nr:glutathione S-transferase family protein [Mesorhizobium sp. J18]TWG93386.1 glutathione S-transferase [Mesorhizobium sp. J18]
MITVHGRASSANVQIVMWTIAELGLPYRRIDVSGPYGGNDTPEFLAMNPNGLVPVIQDGDLTMFESAAIMRYLGATYGDDTFWPKDPSRRASLDMWAEWAKTTFVPAIVPIFSQMVRTREVDRNMALVENSAKQLAKVAKIADARIGNGPFLAGAALTFADIVFAHQLYRYFTLDFDRAETPNLEAYYERLAQRPAYAEHVMVSYEELRAK